MTAEERAQLVRDARDLAERNAKAFSGTFLDGTTAMLRRLADVVEEDGDRA